MSGAIDGLQLDLLTVIGRLEQISDLMAEGTARGQDFAEYLLQERVIKCDVPRLRGHLTPEAVAWEQHVDELLNTPRRARGRECPGPGATLP